MKNAMHLKRDAMHQKRDAMHQKEMQCIKKERRKALRLYKIKMYDWVKNL